MNHSFRRGYCGLVVAVQPSLHEQPCEGALHDPTMGQDLEALGLAASPDDLQRDLSMPLEPLDPPGQGAGVAAVGPDQLHPAEGALQPGEKKAGCVAVLHVGGVDLAEQNQAERIHEDMALAPLLHLPRVVAPRPGVPGAPHALGVDDSGGRGAALAAGQPDPSPQAVVDGLPDPELLELGEEAVAAAPVGHALRDHPPLAAGAQQVEDGVEHAASAVERRTALGWNPGKHRLDRFPLLVGEVALVEDFRHRPRHIAGFSAKSALKMRSVQRKSTRREAMIVSWNIILRILLNSL